MSSSSTESKRYEAVGLGRPPHPFEKADIIVNVVGHNDYVIDSNTWDIVEGDKITVKFLFDDSWSKHTDRKCAVSIDDRVEVFDLVDDQFTIPKHLVVNCDIRLFLKGFFEIDSKGSCNRNGRFIVGDVNNENVLGMTNGNFIATDTDIAELRKAEVFLDDYGHLIVTESKIKPRPEEYDIPYSEGNKHGYIKVDMFETPIKIGSWYDRQ